MQFTLLEYQQDAVRDILRTLARCREDWHQHKERNSFALSSTTGSGKTVIAATVIEALLHGSDEFDHEPDPGAIVLWVSKDPALNLQTKARIIQAADRIPVGDFVLLDKDYAEDSLVPGNVYFINPDKLRDAALFVRKTNNRQTTFWEILKNTVKDPARTLYLIVDEAHEGMKAPRKKDAEFAQTIVQKIINGNGTNAAVPIVWGISATIERFNQAMEAVKDRGTKPNIVIDPKRVQESGLLKNTLTLEIPDEEGDFETTMIRDAAREFAQVCQRWAEYGEKEGLEKPVLPLLVVQIPNKTEGDRGTDEEDGIIRRALDTVRRYWPEFTDDCVAHVLGDRATIELGAYEIPRVAAQDIQTDARLRVLIAKDAVSTGWDCPRAEVLVSLRPGKDATYITQLLGRMVRTPLARTTSDDRLNSASCYLPRFDKATAKKVAEIIMGLRAPDKPGAHAEPAGPRVLLKPVDLMWNPGVPEEVKDLIQGLPSFPKPALAPKPIKRLLKAAQAFGQDGLVPNANDEAHQQLFGVIDGLIARYADAVEAQTKAIMTADIRRFTAQRGEGVDETSTSREADVNTVKDALRQTKRVLTTSVVNRHLRRDMEKAILEDPLNAPITEIQARMAALSRIEPAMGEPTVVEAVENAADALVRSWLSTKRDEIALLPESRQAAYDEIRTLAREPENTSTVIPTDLRVDTVDLDRNPLPTARLHILSDSEGNYPLDEKLNPDERKVIARETFKDSVVGWYRNPSAAGKHSVRIAYKDGDTWRSVHPDFIIVQRNSSGGLVPSIVDPHSTHLADAMPKLLGLAAYAEEHGDRYARIESLAAIQNGELRMLDQKDPKIREVIRQAASGGASLASLFSSTLSQPY